VLLLWKVLNYRLRPDSCRMLCHLVPSLCVYLLYLATRVSGYCLFNWVFLWLQLCDLLHKKEYGVCSIILVNSWWCKLMCCIVVLESLCYIRKLCVYLFTN